MSIFARCAACRAENPHDQRTCRKCGAALEGCKFMVQVRQGGVNVRRSFSALSDALKVEAALLKAAPGRKRGRPRRRDHGKAVAHNKATKGTRPARPGRPPAALSEPEAAPPSAFGLAEPQGQELTLAHAWERYARRVLPTLKHPEFNEGLWRVHVAPALGLWPLDRITAGDVEDFMADMRDKRVPLSPNARSAQKKALSTQRILHAVRLVRRLFNYAVQSGMWSGQNPVKKVMLPKVNNEVVRMLPKEQAQRLLHVLGGWHCPATALAFKLCLLTGKRAGEVFGLEWEQVDLHRGFIRFRIKSMVRGEVQPLPITSAVRAILEEAQRHQYPGSVLVFTTKNGRRIYYSPAWKRIKRRAGLPADFRVHDLRHAFASELVSNGCDLYTVQKLLGHKSPAMTRRYAHLADEALRRGLAQAEALFTGRE